jgi:hypothetical protein
LQRPAVAAAYRGKGSGYEFTVVVEVHGAPGLENRAVSSGRPESIKQTRAAPVTWNGQAISSSINSAVIGSGKLTNL